MADYTTINDSEAYFQTATWTGNATARSIVFDGETDMQPDMVWVKERSASEGAKLFDVARGATNLVPPTAANLEQDQDTSLTSFDSDGFSLGIDTGAIVNDDGVTTSAWCWKAGGSGSSNTTGTINTTKTSVETTSKFSIMTYTGNGSAGATIGHGLGVKPHFIMQKNRDDNENWQAQHKYYGATHYATFNTSNTFDANSARWNDTEPTTDVISLGSDSSVNLNTEKMVLFAWSEVRGFSKFGTYMGNGNADGPMIYTGFSPKLVITKLGSGAGNWVMKTAGFGDAHNPQTEFLYGSTTAAEGDGSHMDFLSNGFKWRDSETNNNQDGSTYVYMAWAQAPYLNSNGVPCNAR